MEASGTRIEPSRVIGEAFETYRNHAGALLGGAVIVIGIAGLIEGLLLITGSLILTTLGILIGLAAELPLHGLCGEARPGRPRRSQGLHRRRALLDTRPRTWARSS